MPQTALEKSSLGISKAAQTQESNAKFLLFHINLVLFLCSEWTTVHLLMQSGNPWVTLGILSLPHLTARFILVLP